MNIFYYHGTSHLYHKIPKLFIPNEASKMGIGKLA